MRCNRSISLMLRAFIGCSVIFLYGCAVAGTGETDTGCIYHLGIKEISTEREYKPETAERLVIGKVLVTRDGEMLPHDETADFYVKVVQLEDEKADSNVKALQLERELA